MSETQYHIPDLVINSGSNLNLSPIQHAKLPSQFHVRQEMRSSMGGEFELSLSEGRFSIQPGAIADIIYENSIGTNGGHAIVVNGYDNNLEKAVIIKVLRKSLDADRNIRDAFYKEARILANLDHPNIPRILGLSAIPINPSSILPAIILSNEPGLTIYQILQTESMATEEIIRAITQIGSAIDYVQLRGLMHSDISLANILKIDSNKFLLLDFGIALGDYRESDDRLVPTHTTYPYVAPELRNAIVNGTTNLTLSELQHADQHALGICAYRMLGGSDKPFDVDAVKKNNYHKEGQVLRLTPRIDPKAMIVLLKATSYNASERFESNTEFAQALREALQ